MNENQADSCIKLNSQAREPTISLWKRMMKILLTGTTGFIGTHLATQLANNGHQITGLLRSPQKLNDELAKKIKVLRGDISIFKDKSLILEEFDIVIHLAGVVAGKNQQEYADINYHATKDLIDWQRFQASALFSLKTGVVR